MSRLRTNFITNRMANGAPTVSNGLVVSGVTTTTSLNVTGNVSVGGTLTYEDVTNIDSVGIGTFGEGIFVPDDKSIRVGGSFSNPDLKIHSSSTYQQGVIDYNRSGTGRALRIRATNLQIENWNGLTPTAKFVGGVGAGHVELNYAGSKKFETTSSGVSIGGTTIITPASGGKLGIGTDSLDSDAYIHIVGQDNGKIILEDRSNNGANLRKNYIGIVNSDNLVLAADEDDLGSSSSIRFRIDNGEKVRITNGGKVGIGTDSPEAKLTVHTTTPGENVFVCHADFPITKNRSLNLYAPATDGGDDPYVFQTPNSLQFKVDTYEGIKIHTNGYVGINTTIPQATLEISDLGSVGPVLLLNGASSTEGDICVDHDENLQIGHWNKSTSTFTQRMSISSAGYVSGNINVPVWYGSQDTQHNVANGTFVKLINLGNDVTNPSINNGGWDESTGTFTAQAGQAGTYYVFGGGGIDDIQANDYIHLRFFKNGSAVGPYARHTNGGGANQISDARHMMIVTLAVGDTIDLRIYHQEGSTEPTEPNRCFFGGYRLSV